MVRPETAEKVCVFLRSRLGRRCAALLFRLSSSTMARLRVSSKYIFEGTRKFFARGVSYGPFRPNSRGERYPEREQVAADFSLMRELGVNLVRTYVAPPPWLLEEAAQCGLRLMVGIPWPFHMAFLDSREMCRDIRRNVESAICALRGFDDAIFAYSLGNEIRSDIVRWHGPRRVERFLRELGDLARQADPDGLFTYSNYPSTEYLDLSFLDLVCFNVYLHREADFRRYLTHLLAITGDRPLLLSETGMDTLREGEQAQAELLAWQARAVFEAGLCGIVVFAFTDEWHTGGSEINDWAFGLVTRERAKKRAFDGLASIFNGQLPPPMIRAPKASVIVAAYNAAATIGACLSSLKSLAYSSYEVIVADDGSNDETARIAEAAGARTLRLTHRGLACTRNAAIAESSGEVVAFIDADAVADRDWLYHLVQARERARADAVGGANFPPLPDSALAAAIAAAPGAPREVTFGDDRLSQLCGASMALGRAGIQRAGQPAAHPKPGNGCSSPFDPAFVEAGDDVDLSWRMSDRGGHIAYAPGAVVIHRRRETIAGYLRQQFGYGMGEGLLWRRYPRRERGVGSIYGGWVSAFHWPGRGARIYYGTFGRGLFQTIYRDPTLRSAAHIVLTAEWVGASTLLLILGAVRPAWAVCGAAGLAVSLAAAVSNAAFASLPPSFDRLKTWIILVLLSLLGPLVRSYGRERVRLALGDRRGEKAGARRVRRPAFALHGSLAMPGLPETPPGRPIGHVLDAIRRELIARAVAVALPDASDPFDLEAIVVPFVRIPINLFASTGGALTLRWRLAANVGGLVTYCAAVFVLLLAGTFSFEVSVLGTVLAMAVWAAIAGVRARHALAILAATVGEAAPEAGQRDAQGAAL